MKNRHVKPLNDPMELPTLRFSPWAWAKLMFLRDLGPTEIGGFAITSDRALLFVEDIVLVAQECSPVSVRFNDVAVADYFDAQVDRGLPPSRFARVWVHTHPGKAAEPSLTDEETFGHVFGACDWAVMFILARGGQSYARLRFNVGPGGDVALDTAVDFGSSFAASGHPAWRDEYLANVTTIEPPGFRGRPFGDGLDTAAELFDPFESEETFDVWRAF